MLAREDVARYLRGGHGQSELQARERIHAYLDELRTTQRYPIYRALKHPLYPILRKIERIDEHVEIAQDATRTGRTIYISNHKSHLDYLVEPLVIDDNGIRPPVIAAGINLFGGPLGLIHATSPARFRSAATRRTRPTRDARRPTSRSCCNVTTCSSTSKEGRSYTGELKAPKTGLLHAAMQAERADSSIVPMAVAYDLVLEDHILAHQGRSAATAVRPRSRRDGALRRRVSVARVRHLRRADSLDGIDPESRRDIMTLAHQIRDSIGRLYKVLPTAVVAAAMRPSITRRELEARPMRSIETLHAAGANLGVEDGRQAVDEGPEPLARAQHHFRRARRPIPGPRAHGASLLRAHAPAPAYRLPPAARAH